MENPVKSIIGSRYPIWSTDVTEWEKFRLVFNGGADFKRKYLTQFSSREDTNEFNERYNVTPVKTYAKSAIIDIRNAIFQRLRDVLRKGGSTNYQKAVAGLEGGVDRRGSSMNSFLGVKILTDLLVMGKAGVFVDAPVLQSPTLDAAIGLRPYLYPYALEDILNFSVQSPENPSEFKAVLLRDTMMGFDGTTMLPTSTIQRYRYLWIEGGQVNLQFYNVDGEEIDRDGNPGGPMKLDLNRIPFVLLDIGDSLLKDISDHQIALLNLGSSDISYALKANFPIITKQTDGKEFANHLKHGVNEDGTATSGGQAASGKDLRVGVTQGLTYPKSLERPGFINPSAEPLKASMELQASLKNEIRELVNLAVESLATRASAESKQMDNQGLEAGLSYIGLILESAERLVAEYWSAYEDRKNQQVATIKYPDRYSLKTDEDRIKESNDLSALMVKIPGQTVKREIAKCVVQSLLGGKVPVDTLEKINQEIDEAPYTTSDPSTIQIAVETGLAGNQTASLALGFNKDEHLQAAADHAERVARIANAQGIKSDPAARGVRDLSANQGAGKEEKSDTTLNDTTKVNQRGEGA